MTTIVDEIEMSYAFLKLLALKQYLIFALPF